MTQLKDFFTKIVTYVAIVATVFNQIGYTMHLDRDIYPKLENAVRIMSFNVLCAGTDEHAMQNRLGIVTRTITEYYPDSIGLQEATPYWMAWLNIMLPEYDYVGVGRDNGEVFRRVFRNIIPERQVQGSGLRHLLAFANA